MRSMVALNQMASPAVARVMIIFKPCSELRPSRTNRSGGPLVGARGVGLLDGGLEQAVQPVPRHRTR